MTERLELLEATDQTIEDAVKLVDIMALRGLLYQLTGDESIGATEVTMNVQGFIEVMDITNPSDIALLQSNGGHTAAGEPHTRPHFGEDLFVE